MGSRGSFPPITPPPSPGLSRSAGGAECVSFLSYIYVCRCVLSHFLVDFADTWLQSFYKNPFTVWERSKENTTWDQAYDLYH